VPRSLARKVIAPALGFAAMMRGDLGITGIERRIGLRRQFFV
jgi:hypothetical protein